MIAIVQRQYLVNDEYVAKSIVKAFRTVDAAKKWIDDQTKVFLETLKEYNHRLSLVAYKRDLINKYRLSHPAARYVKAVTITKWGAGLRQESITPEMHAKRSKEKAAREAWSLGYQAHVDAYNTQMLAAIKLDWPYDTPIESIEVYLEPPMVATYTISEIEMEG